MTIVGLTSLRSSPGATATALAIGAVWRAQIGRALVVEADPAGGVLGLRFGCKSGPSWTSLSADLRNGSATEAVWSNTVPVLDTPCLLAPADPVVVVSAMHRSGSTVAELLGRVEAPVAIDLGRFTANSAAGPLAAVADEVLVVCRPRVEEVQAALYGLRALSGWTSSVGLVVVGSRPHHPEEVADLADVRLAAVLPDDPLTSSAFDGGRFSPRHLRRSGLWRALAHLGEDLLARHPARSVAPPGNLPPPLAPRPEQPSRADLPGPLDLSALPPPVETPAGHTAHHTAHHTARQAAQHMGGEP